MEKVKTELSEVNKRSVNNCDTVEVIKILLEEIKAQNNDILDYTDFSKKQHSELLVIVNV